MVFNASKYYKKRYNTDEEFRLKHIASSTKYHKTKKGKKARQKSIEKRKLTQPDYHKNYMKARRKKARENHTCVNCFKRKTYKTKICKICLEKIRGKHK